MFIRLPSGRHLAYVKPKLGENRFGGTSITHEGITTGRKWGQLETYGGKLTENIVQAVARNLLTFGMHQVDRAGHRIVMHVHDEIVVETATATVDEICKLGATVPDWATGLPLVADGYSCDFYQKDYSIRVSGDSSPYRAGSAIPFASNGCLSNIGSMVSDSQSVEIPERVATSSSATRIL